MSKIIEKAKEKSTVAGVLGFLSTIGLFAGSLIDPLSATISAIANLYLIIVDEKKK